MNYNIIIVQLLLKQKKFPVFGITSIFVCIRIQVKALMLLINPLYAIRTASFLSVVLYLILRDKLALVLNDNHFMVVFEEN